MKIIGYWMCIFTGMVGGIATGRSIELWEETGDATWLLCAVVAPLVVFWAILQYLRETIDR